MITFTIFLVYAVRTLHMSSFLVGFLFGMAGKGGAIVGSLFAMV